MAQSEPTAILVDVVQGTPEWRQARVGSLGASRVHEAIARTRNGWAASRASVLSDIVAERLTGVPAEIYVTEAMRRGQALEPDARAAYAFQRDVDMELVGLVRHPRIAATHAPRWPGRGLRLGGDQVPKHGRAHFHAARRHHLQQVRDASHVADGVHGARLVRSRLLRQPPARAPSAPRAAHRAR